jgi:arylsulfatase A-like enzyme
MRTRDRVRAALLLLALGCGSSAPEGPPDILLITIDTLRADHLGCYGYPRPTSPFIDSLARGSVLFENAQATTSWTLPSHLSLMTSLYPQSHGVERDDRTLPAGIVTLAELLKRAGYETTAFVSWVYVSKRYGFDRGFDQFVELLPPPAQQTPDSKHSIKADAFIDEVLAWSREPPSRPFFLWLHLFDPHVDYEPPLEHALHFTTDDSGPWPGTYRALKPYIRGLYPESKRIPEEFRDRAVALYDGEIRFVDTELARLFEGLEQATLLDRALVALVSDHGEEHDDHGSMEGHQWTLYDEVLRVPLMLRFPDGRYAGRRVAELVQTVDLAPSLLSAIGVEAPAAFEGVDLLPLLDGGPPPRRFAFSQLKRFNVRFAVQDTRWKLIRTVNTGTNSFGVPVTPGFELYDMATDPDEQRNLFSPRESAVRRLAPALRRWIRSAPTGLAPAVAPPNAAERERLRALGYLDAEEPVP